MVGLVDDYFKKFPINSRIKVSDDYGTVKYVGEVKGYIGLWVGVEWDDPSRGKHDGIVNGERYFEVQQPKSGSLVRPGKMEPFQSVEDAVNHRYLGNNDNPLDEKLIQETQQFMQASVFEIVGMEKIAKKQSRIEELTEVSVECSSINSAGYLKNFQMLVSLNLTKTLIWNWQIVADITSQITTLELINLGSNRLQPPSDVDVINLEPDFRHLKHIILSKCGFKDWKDVVNSARLWPDVESLSLSENEISSITYFDCKVVFRNLKHLDLHSNKLSNFDEICKLGKIVTLNSLILTQNGIERVQLPPCKTDEKLLIFPLLQILNLSHNPIKNDIETFNELEKLASLVQLSKTASTLNYEEMFSIAVGLIPQLQTLNKSQINEKQRRGAQYDIWKEFGTEWLATDNNPEARKQFLLKCRAYANLLKKYGSPAEFLIRPPKKVSNLIKIKIQNSLTGEIIEKKVPRKMSVQALQGLIIKHFNLEQTMPKLSYIDANHPTLIVEMENISKSLDFYSIQDGDTVSVEW